MLTLTWVLLTSHCRIEALPGFEFLRCAADSDALGIEANAFKTKGHSDAADDSGHPCPQKNCCSIESAQFSAPRQHDMVPVIVAILPPNPFNVDEGSLPEQVTLGILTSAPPELPGSWQFTFRAALPPRAPSIRS